MIGHYSTKHPRAVNSPLELNLIFLSAMPCKRPNDLTHGLVASPHSVSRSLLLTGRESGLESNAAKLEAPPRRFTVLHVALRERSLHPSSGISQSLTTRDKSYDAIENGQN